MRNWMNRYVGIGLLALSLLHGPLMAEEVDYAHVDSGATVHSSEGANPPPYDVSAALGDGEHLSYPAAVPNWFVIDLGQTRTIRAIEIDWRYVDRTPEDIAIHFGETPKTEARTIAAEGIGGGGKYWYHVLDEPVTARFVRFESLALTEKANATVLNRFSLYGSSRIPRLVESMGERYIAMAPRAEALLTRASAQGLVDDLALAPLVERVLHYHDLLSQDVSVTEDQWRAMEAKWVEVIQHLHRAEAAVSFAEATRASREKGFELLAVDPMTRVFRDVYPQGEPCIQLSSARNEWESGQAAVVAFKDLTGVTVNWEPLRGPTTLEPGALDVQLVAYVKTTQSPVATRHIGWWPDGLMPAAAFDLPAERVQPLWITAKLPEDAPAGEYHSVLTVHVPGQGEQALDIVVRVRDFALPTAISLRNVISLSVPLVRSWYRDTDVTWDEVKYDYYDFWLDRRLNPTSLYGTMVPSREDVLYCLERGMNTFVMQYIYSSGVRQEESYFQKSLNILAEWEPFLREHDLFDKAVVYLADEPTNKAAVTNEINRRSRIIHEKFPEMQRMLVYHRTLQGEFDGHVDMWVPIVGQYDPAEAKQRQAQGQGAWWYTVGNFFLLDRPLVESRLMPWLTWKHDLDGMLYWIMQSSWRGNNRMSRFHPKPGEVMWESFEVAGHADRNGIGNLIYPGPDGRPYSSIRLEMLREGMEDYEYLILLSALIEQAEGHGLGGDILGQARAIMTQVNAMEGTPEPDPAFGEVLMAYRQAMSDVIEALQRSLADAGAAAN